MIVSFVIIVQPPSSFMRNICGVYLSVSTNIKAVKVPTILSKVSIVNLLTTVLNDAPILPEEESQETGSIIR